MHGDGRSQAVANRPRAAVSNGLFSTEAAHQHQYSDLSTFVMQASNLLRFRAGITLASISSRLMIWNLGEAR